MMDAILKLVLDVQRCQIPKMLRPRTLALPRHLIQRLDAEPPFPWRRTRFPQNATPVFQGEHHDQSLFFISTTTKHLRTVHNDI